MDEVKYHRLDSCNKCGGDNRSKPTAFDDDFVSEAKTECQDCGFEDFWAYGFYESSEEIISKCKTYSYL